nr:helix-turn-helix transcriptional regulator [Virgibacillus alimentarius]
MFGKRLKILRNKKKKNQEDVAKDLGISRARYSHYENNHVEPDIDLIRKLADYHNVNTDYLLGRTNKPNGSSESDKNAIIDKIAKEFPDADLMFGDLASMDAEQLEEVYEFIAFKARRKK